jgi:hypothetical protein
MLRLETIDRASFYTTEQLGKTRSFTPEGYLVCVGVPIARTGTQLYHERELNKPGEPAVLKGDADGVVRVQRTAEEVFRPESIASYEGKPITIEHPPEFVTPANRKTYEVGHMQNVRRGADGDESLLLADLVVKDPQAIAFVNRELPQLSSGYDASYVQDRPGHAVQTQVVANHVALVQRGRAGPRVAIKDSIATRDAAARETKPFGPFVPPAELNRQAQAFYGTAPKVVRSSPPRMPTSIADMNGQARDFYRESAARE